MDEDDGTFLRYIAGRLSAIDWETPEQYAATRQRVRDIADRLDAVDDAAREAKFYD